MPDPLATARRYLGRPVRTRRGVLLGRVSDVLSDAESRDPQWLVVRLRGVVPRHRPLPLQLVLEEEHALVAPISADVLRSAPVATVATDLRSSQEMSWRRYWSLAW
ncbi:hypothetical protein ASG73_11360 [Janibacter sp. Soil728]|uniref:PRC-barrel domain-containing protein n=1 Tax=Janibacter sp. Soil728 TaxID=1736393 RepID=UPI0006F49B5B|nr:PRC-barrel domain-containing protein [Janibacter sp. Soil728]KRE36916.1 hypothetical protein ASG73_11360 [Janibacter sp. Soil728]